MKAKQEKRNQPPSSEDTDEESYINISDEVSSILSADLGHNHKRQVGVPNVNIKDAKKKAKGLFKSATFVANSFFQIATGRDKPRSSAEEGPTAGEDPEDYVDELYGSDIEIVDVDSDLEEADW